jgi:putative flavoprotein involved in K+ transport
MNRHIVVAGAGPAGLGAAAVLRRTGFDVTIVERDEGPGCSWRHRYDGLRLNTVRWLSNLPGYRMPRSYGWWVGRDDYVSYLEAYRDRFGLRVETGTEVRGVQRGAAGWIVRTSKGELDAQGVVVATGAFEHPVVPSWPGLETYRGSFQHVATYRNPAPHRNRHVLVVGCGASGLEVALQLAEGGARRVDLSVRSGVHLFPRQIGPAPLTPPSVSRFLPAPVLDASGVLLRAALPGDWPSPLPRPELGLGAGLRLGVEPVVADGVVQALREGRISVVPAVSGFDQDAVRLADGTMTRPDAVIAATGYRHRLDRLVGELGILDTAVSGDGAPDPRVPGLVFVGFQAALTGRLPQLPNQARRAAATMRAAVGR